MSHPPSFNLIDEPWIKVRLLDGAVTELSLAALIEQASQIRDLAGEIPTQDVAIFRLVEAILLGSVRTAHERTDRESLDLWADWWAAGCFPPTVRQYLEMHRARFDLLDSHAPFMQVAGLTTASGNTSGLLKMITDMPDGAPYFTVRGGRSLEQLSFPEAARWLVHSQAFDPAGIKTGASGDDRVKGGKGYSFGYPAWAGNLGIVLVEGESLFQTLMLNLPLALSGPEDLPAWERDPVGAGIDAGHPYPHGPADAFTWPSRRVRLMLEGGAVVDVQISNGDRLEPVDRPAIEPMSAWRENPTRSTKSTRVLTPVRHDPSRRVWQGLAAVLAGESQGKTGVAPGALRWLATLQQHDVLPWSQLFGLRVVGLEYGTQNSVVVGAVNDRLIAPLKALVDPTVSRTAIDAAARANKAVAALASLTRDLDLAAGGDGETARASSFDAGYAALDAPYRQWLRSLTPETARDDALNTWSTTARQLLSVLAREQVTAAGIASWAGREHNGRWLNSGLASQWFALALRKALPQTSELHEQEIA